MFVICASTVWLCVTQIRYKLTHRCRLYKHNQRNNSATQWPTEVLSSLCQPSAIPGEGTGRGLDFFSPHCTPIYFHVSEQPVYWQQGTVYSLPTRFALTTISLSHVARWSPFGKPGLSEICNELFICKIHILAFSLPNQTHKNLGKGGGVQREENEGGEWKGRERICALHFLHGGLVGWVVRRSLY